MKFESRYSAKLLFQFRVEVNGSSGVRRLCEERILTFSAENARQALREAKRRGRAAKYRFPNSDGNPVYFEFVGVLELIRLLDGDSDEVWYEIVERVRPMERRSTLIPPEKRLSAIRHAE
ncbi:hypothetical protein Pan44_32680 [Caulifigura coniformis]|uniref:DUF4288 domain-containing protein n=1 Tax=Caulifigura coniformis TaxID=2527983 RepID=A0A517SGG8_9PLAN|nr:DUF4288 domain-containing protein [Caulifigura coniformis]QDT55226.1 hypothetical protein Pan44_32680 [Caulifigura coniformis]